MGVLFFAVGFGLVGYTPFKFHQRSILSTAEEVPATVLEIDRTSSSRGGVSITGRYEYVFKGKTYQSERLAIFSETESLYENLLAAQKEKQQVNCLVAPSDPGFSAFDIEWRVIDILTANLLGLPFLYFGSIYLYRHFKSKSR